MSADQWRALRLAGYTFAAVCVAALAMHRFFGVQSIAGIIGGAVYGHDRDDSGRRSADPVSVVFESDGRSLDSLLRTPASQTTLTALPPAIPPTATIKK